MSFLITYIDIDTNLQNRSLIKEDVFIEQLSLKFENIDPAMIVSLVKSLRDVLSTELIAKKKQHVAHESPEMYQHMQSVLDALLKDPGRIASLKKQHDWIGQGYYTYIEDLLSNNENKMEHFLTFHGHSEEEIMLEKKQTAEFTKIITFIIELKIETMARYSRGDRILTPQQKKTAEVNENWARFKFSAGETSPKEALFTLNVPPSRKAVSWKKED